MKQLKFDKLPLESPESRDLYRILPYPSNKLILGLRYLTCITINKIIILVFLASIVDELI